MISYQGFFSSANSPIKWGAPIINWHYFIFQWRIFHYQCMGALYDIYAKYGLSQCPWKQQNRLHCFLSSLSVFICSHYIWNYDYQDLRPCTYDTSWSDRASTNEFLKSNLSCLASEYPTLRKKSWKDENKKIRKSSSDLLLVEIRSLTETCPMPAGHLPKPCRSATETSPKFHVPIVNKICIVLQKWSKVWIGVPNPNSMKGIRFRNVVISEKSSIGVSCSCSLWVSVSTVSVSTEMTGDYEFPRATFINKRCPFTNIDWL